MRKYVITLVEQKAYSIEKNEEIKSFFLDLMKILEENSTEIKAIAEQRIYFAKSGGISRTEFARVLRQIAYKVQHEV